MVKGKLYKSFVLTFILCCIFSVSVCASDINSSNSGYVPDGQDTEIAVDGGGEAGTDGIETGEIVSNDDSNGISEQEEILDPEEVVLEEQKIFSPLERFESGEASLTDVYNALASIHNLLFLGLILALVVWSYNMITSAFRRFIG